MLDRQIFSQSDRIPVFVAPKNHMVLKHKQKYNFNTLLFNIPHNIEKLRSKYTVGSVSSMYGFCYAGENHTYLYRQSTDVYLSQILRWQASLILSLRYSLLTQVIWQYYDSNIFLCSDNIKTECNGSFKNTNYRQCFDTVLAQENDNDCQNRIKN